MINRFILSGWILPRNVRTCGGITYVHGRRRGILGVEHTVGGQEVCYAWSFHRGQVSASECHLISLTGIPSSGFPKLTRFLAHHDKIIAKFIPKLKKHFDQYNLDSILYSLKWFFVVFIERVSTGSQNKLRIKSNIDEQTFKQIPSQRISCSNQQLQNRLSIPHRYRSAYVYAFGMCTFWTGRKLLLPWLTPYYVCINLRF